MTHRCAVMSCIHVTSQVKDLPLTREDGISEAQVTAMMPTVENALARLDYKTKVRRLSCICEHALQTKTEHEK